MEEWNGWVACPDLVTVYTQATASRSCVHHIFIFIDGVFRRERKMHRQRIKTEKKAKVLAAVWGTESMHFFAVLAILHQDDVKNWMNCTRTI